MASLEDFEEQILQEALAKEAEAAQSSEQEYSVGGKLFRKDADGTTFEFDPEKRAWFPKIDEDFIARYQMSYGTGVDPSSVDTSSCAESYWSNPPADINSEEYRNWYNQYCSYFYPQQFMSQRPRKEATDSDGVEYDSDEALFAASTSESREDKDTKREEDGKQKKKKKNTDLLTKHKPVEPPAWFELEDTRNTNVYVSGLPEDITEEEFKDFMTKVGVVAFDPVTRKPKLKLYSNSDGTYKGDGRCCYIKPESVDLALQILDSSEIRGHVISVEKAHFELKGQYDPSKKRRKLTKQEKKKWQEKQQKILGWQPEKPVDARPRWERIVVIKHAFLPTQFEQDPAQINEISADFREECSKFGEVRKVVVCDRHPDGVVMVTFSAPEEADSCVTAVNGRWFAGCQLEATNWDGRTKYQVQETQEEMEKRLSSWHTYLESDSHSKEDQTLVGTSSLNTPLETTTSSTVNDPDKPDSASEIELETVITESKDESVVSEIGIVVNVSDSVTGVSETC